MQIAIGSMMHESNTFSSVSTDLDAFKRTQYLSGEEILNYHRGRLTELGGMLDALSEAKASPLPTLSACAIPSGVVTKEAFIAILDGIVEPIRKNRAEISGVLLALHGAMITEGQEDPEGELIRAVRSVLSEGTYIGVSLDMHAHLTRGMVDAADFFVAYRTHPHVDQYETGLKTGKILLRAIKERINFGKAFIRLPLLVPAENRDETRAKLMDELVRIEKQPGVVSSLVTISHPWSDISIQGDTVFVATDNSIAADNYARQIAQKFWDLRYDFPLDLYSIQQAVKIGFETRKKGPTVICEVGDCILGGASGDVVTSLRYLMQRGATEVVVAAVVDPESVASAAKAGVGKNVQLRIGGKLFKDGNPPLTFDGVVTLLGKDVKADGRDKISQEDEIQIGRFVVVKGHGVEVVIVEKPGRIGEPFFLQALGIKLEGKRFIVLKDTVIPTISYRSVASEVLLVYTTGSVQPHDRYSQLSTHPAAYFPARSGA